MFKSLYEVFTMSCLSKRATRITPPTKGLHLMMLADNWVQLRPYIINKAYICTHLTRGIPVALFLTDGFNLRDSNTSKPNRPKTPLSICCFLPTGKWSHEVVIQLLKPFNAMMSVERVCYADVTPYYGFIYASQ